MTETLDDYTVTIPTRGEQTLHRANCALARRIKRKVSPRYARAAVICLDCGPDPFTIDRLIAEGMAAQRARDFEEGLRSWADELEVKHKWLPLRDALRADWPDVRLHLTWNGRGGRALTIEAHSFRFSVYADFGADRLTNLVVNHSSGLISNAEDARRVARALDAIEAFRA